MDVRYRTHLQAAVAMSAAPYGYTLTVWTSGAVTMHSRGLPTAWQALLFLAGAVVGFAVVGAIALGNPSQVLQASPDRNVRLWGGFHLPSVGGAIAAVALFTELVDSGVVWPCVGFLGTSIYLLVLAGQFTLADEARRRRLIRPRR